MEEEFKPHHPGKPTHAEIEVAAYFVWQNNALVGVETSDMYNWLFGQQQLWDAYRDHQHHHPGEEN